jgi:hypothetical protein
MMMGLLTGVSKKAVIAVKWKYTASVYLKKHHCLLYRDNDLGIQKQVMTRRERSMFRTHEQRFYFIDDVEDTFYTEEELVKALAKKK